MHGAVGQVDGECLTPDFRNTEVIWSIACWLVRWPRPIMAVLFVQPDQIRTFESCVTWVSVFRIGTPSSANRRATQTSSRHEPALRDGLQNSPAASSPFGQHKTSGLGSWSLINIVNRDARRPVGIRHAGMLATGRSKFNGSSIKAP